MNKNDYCRTCLRPKAEIMQLRSLESLLPSDGVTDANTTLLDCLLFCTKLDKEDNLSDFLCEQCSMALEIAYNFIRNALIAHEVWRQKAENAEQNLTNNKMKTKYRCKLCGIKLVSKRELKEHGKSHAGELTYDCSVCEMSTTQKQQLYDHYVMEHKIEPSVEQLKPKKILKPEITLQKFNNIEGQINENSTETSLTEATELSTDGNLAVGSEYILLADGSLQALEDSNVLIEYINTDNNDKVMTNIEEVPTNTEEPTNQSALDIESVMVQELGELIIIPQQKELRLPEAELAAENVIEEVIEAQKEEDPQKLEEKMEIHTENSSVTCKICSREFAALKELKKHMLNHRDIPQFFCDKCTFYTFYKIDIKQHYKTKHKLQPTTKQLEPRNRAKIAALNTDIYYKCNLCAHKTLVKDNMRRHYVTKHNIPKNEVSKEMETVNGEKPMETDKMENKNKVVITSNMKLNGHNATNLLNNEAIFETQQSQESNKSSMNISFDFNGDTIFDELMDTNEDGKCNTSSLLASNIMLTSDEEDAILKPEVSHKCNICQKIFSTYYKLENHMFLHRGLAPFHCEMCTNLYHEKASLSRHYLAVHKTEPTREMLQPKGGKVNNMSSIDNITVNKGNIPTLWCGKCPFETIERVALIEHLRMNHNTDNEDLIFSKLLYECPFCIRSYPTEVDLILHLQKGHSITTLSYGESNHQPNISTENSAILANVQLNNASNVMDSQHTCRLCFESYNSFEQLEKHICKLFTQVSKT